MAVNGYLLKNRIGILVIGLIAATPMPIKVWRSFCTMISQKGKGAFAVRLLECILSLMLLVLCTAYLIDGSFNPFLYFRF